ncbi:MAG: Na+/H+ antiporter subunit E [Rhizobiales bacterium]|nr:Na+/H+ antiporter subunit E [Hyphomicrobiales bacterium]
MVLTVELRGLRGGLPRREWLLLQIISLAVVLSVLWLLLSGHWHDGLLLGLGLASVALTLVVGARMGVVDREGHPIHLALRGLVYWPWLIKEIVVANIDVAKAILGMTDDVRPSLFTVPASQKTDLGKTIYANSITLTPGTVTIAMDDDQLTIHALTPGARDGLGTGEMDRRVTGVEGER